MQLLYNSDSFVVVRFDLAAPADGPAGGSGAGTVAHEAGPRHGGYEIVDKFARKEIFLQGLLAERFAAGVQELVDATPGTEPSVEALDEYIAGYTVLAQQPVLMH